MTTRQQKSMKAIAIFVAFAIAQISIQLSFASTNSPSYAMLVQQQLIVRVSTSGNRPILVNGNSTASGGSLATGAIIETPDGVSATIDLGPLGTLDIAPNTKVVLDFDCPPAAPGAAPQPCKVKTKVLAGCVVLKTKPNTLGQIDSEVLEKVQESGTGGGAMNFCAAGAVAGAGGAGAAAPVAGAAATTGGIGAGTIAAVVVAGGLLAGGLVTGFTGGGNPSGTTP